MIKEQVVQIIIDHRESRSGLIDELIDYAYETTTHRITTNVETAQLEVADIICSDRVGIERKSCDDFVDTIVNPDRDMPRQLSDLSRTFPRPLVILEGGSVYGLRGIHPEALRAHLSMICVSFGIPILPTMCVEETAAQVVTIARREQFREKRKISIPHTKRTTMTLPQRQVYAVSSIGSGVGATMAEALLKRFKTIEAVMCADEEDLIKVDGIGQTTASKIREIVGGTYKA